MVLSSSHTRDSPGVPGGEILNLTDCRAAPARNAQVELLRREGPERIVMTLAEQQSAQLHLSMPSEHQPRPPDVRLSRLHASIAAAAERGPKDFTELLSGVGPRTVESLALVAEVIYGTPSRFEDPARFSYAHGGKDGFPFPVPLDVYDQTNAVLKRAMQQAKLGQRDRIEALKRLDQQARWLEGQVGGPDFESLMRTERGRIQSMNPRSVGVDRASSRAGKAVRGTVNNTAAKKQLKLL